MSGNKQPVTVDVLIANHLARLPRGGNKLTADTIGVSPATLSRWADGLVIPPVWRAEKIAEAIKEPAQHVQEAINASERLRHSQVTASDERLRLLEKEAATVRQALRRMEKRTGELEQLVRQLADQLDHSGAVVPQQ